MKEIDWLGNAFVNQYDALGRLIKKIGADGVVLEELEYNDNNAQVKSITRMDGSPLTMVFEYDKSNRLIKKTNNGIAVETLTYDGSGNVETKTDGNGNTYTYYYNDSNKLIRVVNPLSYETVYNYDLNGNLIAQKNEKGDETQYEYNCLNLMKKKIDADGRSGSAGSYIYDLKKVEAYTYYPNGLLKEKVDRNGIHSTYKYDIHGRLLETKAGSLTVKNTYDKNGNKLSMTDATGTTGRIYDAMNRCIVKTVPNIGATVFDYDVLTELGAYKEVTTDPKGNISSKVYDELGRVIAVEEAGTIKATYVYYENGQKKSVSYPQNAAMESYTYYPNGQLHTLSNTKGGTVLYNYSYTYDNAGNQLSKTEAKDGGIGLVTTYQYDRLNQLLKVMEPASVRTEYTYDQAGNRKSEAKTSDGAIKLLTYNYNEQNRLISTKEDIGTTKETVNYIYDNNGNLLYSKKEQLALITDPKNIPKATFSMFIMGQTTEEENPFVAWMSSYSYDEFNQMTKSVTKEGVIESKYNGEGLRTEKTLNDELTRFLYIEDQPILEVDQYGREVARNILGTNLVSRVVDKTTEMYYLYNGHADVTELITPQGTIVAEYTYDAFGVPKTTTGTADNPFRYAGYQYDESGLYYLQSRMYNPVIARFMQEDTYRGELNDPLSLNLYAYCNNNPLIYDDPDGHSIWSKIKKAASKVSSAVKSTAKKATTVVKVTTAKVTTTVKAAATVVKTNTVKAATAVVSKATNAVNKVSNTVTVAVKKVASNGISNTTARGGTTVGSNSSSGNNSSSSSPKGLLAGSSAVTQLVEDSSKLNLVNGYFEAQKNPQEAQRGAKDAIRQLSFVIGGSLTDAGQAAAGYTFAGDKLSTRERGMFVAGAVIPFVNGPEIRGATRLTEEIIGSGTNEVASGLRTAEKAGISLSNAVRIQNAANRTKQEITVVGSRANGTSSTTSDWDYFMSGNSAQRHSAASSLPRGTAGGEINSMGRETGIDTFTNYLNSPNYLPLDPTLPHVRFTPK
ncbi:MAG TPA: RHS repeat-associated core domain-containing protein [Anaerovoracaceae bacterium]|nr:RHS repeat-associated core domain-containing protein [Anaerovoracaceae bacterium]